MKKYFIFLIISSLSQLSASHNFYGGVALNGNSLAGKRNDSAVNTTPVAETFSNNKRTQKRAVYAGVFVGYLFKANNFGIGPEFFYNYGKLESAINPTFTDPGGPSHTVFNIAYKIANQAGAHLRLGYFVESYFLYALGGIQYQTYNFEMTAQHVEAANTTNYNNKSKKKQASSFSYGFGAQKSINENYTVGVECKFAHFPNKSFTFTLNDGERTTLTSSFKYKIQSLSLKIMYVF